jgi:azurin
LAALPAVPVEEMEHHFVRLAGALQRGEARPAAAVALLQLSRSCWQPEAAAGAAASVLKWAASVPAKDRTDDAFLVVTQCADELASVLPPGESAPLRRELRRLSVPVLLLNAVREQMRYDRPRLVVEAGKPFQIVLQNDDFMAHNLALVKPGSRAKVAALSQTMSPSQLDGAGRAYMPKSDDILAATRLVEPGRREVLKVAAIEETGDYEYVCTVPNHAIVMWGTLVVTDDVDAWLQQHAADGAISPEPRGDAPHDHGK